MAALDLVVSEFLRSISVPRSTMEHPVLVPPSGIYSSNCISNLLLLRTPRTGSRGTPIRVRSDIQTDRRVRQEFAPGVAGDVGGGVPSSEVYFFFCPHMTCMWIPS